MPMFADAHISSLGYLWYQCFLLPVQSFSACTFSKIYALIVPDTNFHQFGRTLTF